MTDRTKLNELEKKYLAAREVELAARAIIDDVIACGSPQYQEHAKRARDLAYETALAWTAYTDELVRLGEVYHD